jgi:hypothetical protein
MIYLIIENAVVANAIEADKNTEVEANWILYDPTLHEGVNIGWVYADGVFSAPEPDPVQEGTKVRMRRAAMLVESDTNVLPDRWARMTSEQQIAWGDYRQALRDIPIQDGFPFTIVWPQKPE